jgi:hypothetical protein
VASRLFIASDLSRECLNRPKAAIKNDRTRRDQKIDCDPPFVDVAKHQSIDQWAEQIGSAQRRPGVRKYHSWFEKSSFRRYPLEFTAVAAHTITIVCYHSLVHTTFQLTRASPHEVDRDRSSEALSEMALPGGQSTNVGQKRSRVQPTGTKCALIRLRESIAEDPLYYSPRTLSAR